jgi:aspartate/methionine/tyrosine aminotransferase
MRVSPPLALRSESPDPLFVMAIIRAMSDIYCAEKNIKGHISIGVAENTLSADFITRAIDMINREHPLEPVDLNYADFHGSSKFRAQLARYLQKFIYDVPHTVDPNHIIVYNGAGSIIESLASCICDEGEYVMIPAPMYLAFENDLSKRFHCKVLPVHMPYNAQENVFELNETVIQNAYAKAKQENMIVKAFILCQPNNPTGDIYSRQLINWLIEWCSEESLHFISDEVYARSVFNAQNGDKYVSAGTIMLEGKHQQNAIHDYKHVHIVYSFSKDLTLNGFRIGVLHTVNDNVLKFMQSNSYFQSVSTHTQKMLTHLLEKHDLLEEFFQVNCERLLQAYNTTCSMLDGFNIKYVQAKAGVFIWIDLSAEIKKKLKKTEITLEDELEFWSKCCEGSRVYIPAGQFFKCDTPGWFRVCFTAHRIEVTKIAFERIINWINSE